MPRNIFNDSLEQDNKGKAWKGSIRQEMNANPLFIKLPHPVGTRRMKTAGHFWILGMERAAVCEYSHNLVRYSEFLSQLAVSEYSGDLKSRLVWILNGLKEVELQMVQISNRI